MGCCGERQKFENPENEQKWDYIVGELTCLLGTAANVYDLESVRFSLLILPHPSLVWHSLYSAPNQCGGLCSRSLHLRQSAFLR